MGTSGKWKAWTSGKGERKRDGRDCRWMRYRHCASASVVHKEASMRM